MVGGAREVVAIDRNRSKTTALWRLIQYVGCLDIEVVCGDYENASRRCGSFDIVTASCFLSHLPRDNTFIEVCDRVLGPIGQLWLYDDNNGWSPIRRVTVMKEWLRAELFGEVGKESSFLALRRFMIEEYGKRAGWGRARIEYAAHATRGLWGDQIEDFCRALDCGQSLPSPDFCFVNPRTGVAEERLLAPGRLTGELARRGFTCVLFPGSPLAGTYTTWWQPLLRFPSGFQALCGEFEVLATRTGRATCT